MINTTVEVSNSGGTTPNFTAAMTSLGTFLEAELSQLQPAVYTYVYDGETEKWAPHEPKGITLTIVDDTEDLLAAGDTITVTVTADEVNVTDPMRRTPSMYDAAVDGVMYRGIPSRTGYVTDETELTMFEDEHPGFIAIKYGFANAWQLGADGEWVAMALGGGGGGGGGSGGGILKVSINSETGALDKTWKQIYDAINAGYFVTVVFPTEDEDGAYQGIIYSAESQFSGYGVYVYSHRDEMTFNYVASTENDYPVFSS